jgi:nitroreductase
MSINPVIPAHSATSLSVFDAIAGRRSVRGFLETYVAEDTIKQILALASRAPSGTNIQPWRVRVLMGAAKQRLSNAVLLEREKGLPEPSAEYFYPIASIEPYASRRRKLGWDLYSLLGVEKGDFAATRREIDHNFRFFGAPVGMIFTLDRRIGQGAFMELGTFLQNIMLAARGFGLETCPQAAWANYHEIVRRELSIGEEEMVMCGMSMGHIDPAAAANSLRTDREAVETFAEFLNS